MKKVPFLILLIAGLPVSLLAIGLLLSNLGVLSYLIGLVLLAGALIPFFIKLKKTEDEAQKAKLRRKILLIVLIPIVIGIVAVVAVVASLLLYFG